jgi:hypothetical protein
MGLGQRMTAELGAPAATTDAYCARFRSRCY